MSGIRSAPAALGKYQIVGVLGRGAMGTVCDGWDPVIGRHIAIETVRLLDPDDTEALARFKNEAQAVGLLPHRIIVSVHESGESDENAHIVMEFVEGQSHAMPRRRAAVSVGGNRTQYGTPRAAVSAPNRRRPFEGGVAAIMHKALNTAAPVGGCRRRPRQRNGQATSKPLPECSGLCSGCAHGIRRGDRTIVAVRWPTA
jgi:Protein kinase domain